MRPNPYTTQATIKFVGLKEAYQAGDTLNMDLVVENFPAYSHGHFDLWAALHAPNTPDAQFGFLTGTSSEPLFTLEPQSFQGALETVDSQYHLLKDFTVPLIEAGEYVFYALLVENGANPLEESQRNRSVLAVQSTTVRD